MQENRRIITLFIAREAKRGRRRRPREAHEKLLLHVHIYSICRLVIKPLKIVEDTPDENNFLILMS